MTSTVIVLNEERNVSLTCYLQQVENEFAFSKRPAIFVLPGGGYNVCSDIEADPVAMAFLRAGYHAFILRYTLRGKGCWPLPIEDYDNAVDLVRDHADEWGVDMEHFATVGFSAGGHLAACTATIARNKPRAAILGYPAILQDLLDACAPGMPSPAEHVNKDTCPCFIFATRTDKTVPMENEFAMMKALTDHKIMYETHLYSFGEHGFSTGEAWLKNGLCPRAPHWVDDSIEWLSEVMGRFTMRGFTDPLYPTRVDTDEDDFLSIFCTITHIRKQPDRVQELLQPMLMRLQTVCDERGFTLNGILSVLGTSTVKEMMETLQFTEKEIRELDVKLKKIENQKGI